MENDHKVGCCVSYDSTDKSGDVGHRSNEVTVKMYLF